MATYGLTATGFVPKTVEIIIDELNAEFREEFGASLPLSADTELGRAIAIFADREAAIWEYMEAVHASMSPTSATGARLDDLCALTGTIRKAAFESLVTLTLTGTAATNVLTGSQASVTGSGEIFTTTADATLLATDAWSSSTAYALGARVTNSSQVYVCTVAGTSAGSGGPSITDAGTEVDGTVTWAWVGAGTADIDVAAQSENTGAIVGAAGDIATIVTPVAGWDDVNNLNDATLGDDIETDEALRVRRESEIADAGNTTVDAARAALAKVSGVTNVSAFWNHTDVTDADGVPPHAVEFLVQGGTDQDIWDKLLEVVAGGIETHGTEAGTADDSEGTAHPREFSRPTEINIYTDITLTYDADLYPSDGDDQIEAAIVAIPYTTGLDVHSSRIKAACYTVAGVLNVSLAEIDTSPSPSAETSISITSRQLAKQDTSRITVSSSAATP